MHSSLSEFLWPAACLEREVCEAWTENRAQIAMLYCQEVKVIIYMCLMRRLIGVLTESVRLNKQSLLGKLSQGFIEELLELGYANFTTRFSKGHMNTSHSFEHFHHWEWNLMWGHSSIICMSLCKLWTSEKMMLSGGLKLGRSLTNDRYWCATCIMELVANLKAKRPQTFKYLH